MQSQQTHLSCIQDHGDIPANLADLHEHLGGIPFERICFRPEPGTATEEDLCKWKLCELIDGTIVVRALCMWKSLLNSKLQFALAEWLGDRKGHVFPGVGLRISPATIRLPEIMYFSEATWGGRPIDDDIASFPADLVVDFKTEQNTEREMQRRRDEHRALGTRLIWTVDTTERGVSEIDNTEPTERTRWIGLDDNLEHAVILPGFHFSVRQWFEDVDSIFEPGDLKGKK